MGYRMLAATLGSWQFSNTSPSFALRSRRRNREPACFNTKGRSRSRSPRFSGMQPVTKTCFWPLYEVVDGTYRLTRDPVAIQPIEHWLAGQSGSRTSFDPRTHIWSPRFRHPSTATGRRCAHCARRMLPSSTRREQSHEVRLRLRRVLRRGPCPARRQGPGARRDDAARPAGSARLHDHDGCVRRDDARWRRSPILSRERWRSI